MIMKGIRKRKREGKAVLKRITPYHSLASGVEERNNNRQMKRLENKEGCVYEEYHHFLQVVQIAQGPLILSHHPSQLAIAPSRSW